MINYYDEIKASRMQLANLKKFLNNQQSKKEQAGIYDDIRRIENDISVLSRLIEQSKK